MFRQCISSVRTLSYSAARCKDTDLIGQLFINQIRDLGAKQKQAGSLVNTSPELKKSLDEQLNRLANKFRLANSDIVGKLAVKFEEVKIENSVSAAVENTTIEDLIAKVKKEEASYLAEREAKIKAARARDAALTKE